jgi:hypothetical protein
MTEEVMLDVYTASEFSLNVYRVLDAVDDNGAVFIMKYPRGTDHGRLYKLTALGPAKLPLQRGMKQRMKLPDREPSRVWEEL